MPEPESFEQALKRYDPLLSLRWGPHVQAWVIDRKAPKGISKPLWDTLEWAVQQPNCEPLDHERYLSAKSGNRPVIHTKILGNYVFDRLYQDDLMVHGTRFVDEHMKRLEAERAKKRQGALGPDASKMAVDAIDFLNRRRIDPSPEEQRRVFEDVMGHELSPSKTRRKLNKAILNAKGQPAVKEPEPEKPIRIVVPTTIGKK